eukprot:14799069-Alexandrium_andersonii.AAC.1
MQVFTMLAAGSEPFTPMSESYAGLELSFSHLASVEAYTSRPELSSTSGALRQLCTPELADVLFAVGVSGEPATHVTIRPLQYSLVWAHGA